MYFKYSKSAQKSAFIIATLYSLAFSVISSVIVSFIIRIITSNNYKYNDIISIIIGIACFVSFETVYLITKKGIYLSDDKLIIKNGYKEIGQGAFIDFRCPESRHTSASANIPDGLSNHGEDGRRLNTSKNTKQYSRGMKNSSACATETPLM